MYSHPLVENLTSPRFPTNNDSSYIIMTMRVRQHRNLTIVPSDRRPKAELDRGIANNSVEDKSCSDIRLNGSIRDQRSFIAGCCSPGLACVSIRVNVKVESVKKSFIRMANLLTLASLAC
jgi:hypothetical protein